MRAIIVSTIALLAACSSPTEPDEIVEVSGRVTVAGEPAGQVTVWLQSAQQCRQIFLVFDAGLGPCVSGSAVTGDDGRYSLVIDDNGGKCLSGTVIFYQGAASPATRGADPMSFPMTSRRSNEPFPECIWDQSWP